MNRLELTWTTTTPLSHIGESISADTYLSTMPIPQKDSSYKDIFIYSGNAIRGQMRDNAILYLIDLLKIKDKSIKPTNHDFLFSSGTIGGAAVFSPQAIDDMTKVYPLFKSFGGNLNNMMMPGTFAISDAIPICKETEYYLRIYNGVKAKNGYHDLLCERSFSRHDDSKHDQHFLPDLSEDKKVIQMRYTNQLLNAGVTLKSEIHINKSIDGLDFGAFCSTLEQFKSWSFIGGMHNKGFGQVQLDITLNNDAFYSSYSDCSDKYNEALGSYKDYMLNENKQAFLDRFIEQ